MFWIFVIGLLCDSFKLSTNEYVYVFHCIFLLILFFWCSNLKCHRTKRKYKRKKLRSKHFKDRNETETVLLLIGSKKHKKRIKHIRLRQYYLPYKSRRTSKPSKDTLTRAYNSIKTVCVSYVCHWFHRIKYINDIIRLQSDMDNIITEVFNLLFAIALFPLIYFIHLCIEDFICFVYDIVMKSIFRIILIILMHYFMFGRILLILSDIYSEIICDTIWNDIYRLSGTQYLEYLLWEYDMLQQNC